MVAVRSLKGKGAKEEGQSDCTCVWQRTVDTKRHRWISCHEWYRLRLATTPCSSEIHI